MSKKLSAAIGAVLAFLAPRTVEAEAAMAGVASKATYTGAGVSLGGVALSSDLVALSGLVIAVGGFLVNWYYKREADKRAEALWEARMERVKKGRRTDTDLLPLGEDD